MFTQFEGNERHYLKITDIRDNSYYDKPNVTLRGVGVIGYRSGTSDTGLREETYSITVRVFGKLMGYVLNELSIGDQVYLIGHSAMGKVNGYTIRITVAEQIYKSDWVNYFSFGYKTNDNYEVD